MLDVLRKAIKSSTAQFIEARAVDAWTDSILVKDKEVKNTVSGNSVGFSVRVLCDKAWGFASSNSIADLDTAVDRAERLARRSAKHAIGARLVKTPKQKKHTKDRVKLHPKSIGIDQKAKRCLTLSKHGLKKKISSIDIQYTDSYGKAYYTNSENTELQASIVRSLFAVSAYTKSKGKVFRANDRAAGIYGFELIDKKKQMVTSTTDKALLLARSSLPPKGMTQVVIDPRMAGVLAHEAVGHACEADIIINKQSILGNKRNKRIGSPCVTIVDDATLPKLFGSYNFDSEGVPGTRKTLVQKGVLKSFLSSRETAAKLGIKPTGNSRAESVQNFPLVRMSNTFFEKGDHSFEELLEPIKHGVFVSGMRGGVTETSTGFFQFASEHGYLIEDGELTKPLRDITIVGNIMTTLKLVEACGKKQSLGHPGFCGKGGQSVPVSDGGPHIRIKEVLVGGA